MGWLNFDEAISPMETEDRNSNKIVPVMNLSNFVLFGQLSNSRDAVLIERGLSAQNPVIKTNNHTKLNNSQISQWSHPSGPMNQSFVMPVLAI
ncbi:hypothetical protein CEXT_147481 [Caerostris extrusa]|uniref:Uncharacterized protein n=1 Tax=Caerostris extrusa TaxID=172846 RepID=A0AAV4M5S0_CAEEX|nr:hypothetical protein CEXT_147481 [Caerostris extrusa]